MSCDHILGEGVVADMLEWDRAGRWCFSFIDRTFRKFKCLKLCCVCYHCIVFHCFMFIT